MADVVTLAFADITAEVVPARGALVTALRIGSRDVLYLDPATLADPAKNVRGGIPLLFPFAGKLVNETFLLANTKVKQHGFARDRVWEVTARDAASVRMTLGADAETRAVYPYTFTATHAVMLVAGGIQLELTIVAGDEPLPVSPGWHPYFATTDKSSISVALPGAEGFRDDREFDFGVVAAIDGRTRATLPGLGALELAAAPELRHVQFWSQPGKPFVCIEPFFGPANTINTEGRGWIPANEARTYWMRIRLA
jgi:galactose mutarotase-like enzyme